MMKAKRRLTRRWQILPIGAGDLQKPESADDIGFDESRGAVDGTVDMALRREMHDDIGPERRKKRLHRRRITNIQARKMEKRTCRNGIKIFEIARVSQFIEDADLVTQIANEMPHNRGTDKACAAGHQETSHVQNPFLRL